MILRGGNVNECEQNSVPMHLSRPTIYATGRRGGNAAMAPKWILGPGYTADRKSQGCRT